MRRWVNRVPAMGLVVVGVLFIVGSAFSAWAWTPDYGWSYYKYTATAGCYRFWYGDTSKSQAESFLSSAYATQGYEAARGVLNLSTSASTYQILSGAVVDGSGKNIGDYMNVFLDPLNYSGGSSTVGLTSMGMDNGKYWSYLQLFNFDGNTSKSLGSTLAHETTHYLFEIKLNLHDKSWYFDQNTYGWVYTNYLTEALAYYTGDCVYQYGERYDSATIQSNVTTYQSWFRTGLYYNASGYSASQNDIWNFRAIGYFLDHMNGGDKVGTLLDNIVAFSGGSDIYANAMRATYGMWPGQTQNPAGTGYLISYYYSKDWSGTAKASITKSAQLETSGAQDLWSVYEGTRSVMIAQQWDTAIKQTKREAEIAEHMAGRAAINEFNSTRLALWDKPVGVK
jgi:hypothetical protein